MRIWKNLIRPNHDEADTAQGYAWAKTCEEALSLADHPDALAFPKHPEKTWQGPPTNRIFWTIKPS